MRRRLVVGIACVLALAVLVNVGTVYVRAASLYIGDASSQVYEFLERPRPCIFVNCHGVEWRGRKNMRISPWAK